ncbi:MAG: hypothetical protein JAY90_21935 [Candidatus Thiodiazotropha lotti]|nr:hypothetical protein [Candidatus Thiodiazotropha lotti]
MKILFPIAVSALMLNGCATLTADSTSGLGLRLEKKNSSMARIAEVNVSADSQKHWVRGSVMRLLPGKGPIYGHLHIDLLDAKGERLVGAITKPTRANRSSRRARFTESFLQEQSKQRIAVVKLTHHVERHKHP